ncbi:hypothetical protein DITRI_Ditri02bG0038500 [Diplodiscus trichospermus]
MATGNGEEVLNSRHACAACKHQRKKCDNECVFAPHFPATRANSFREVHKIFGVKNMTGILEHLSFPERKKAVESLEWEAFSWKEDPIEGPLGVFRKLEEELELLKNQQNELELLIINQQNQQQNNAVMVPNYQTKSGLIGFNHNSAGIIPNTNISATNFDYANNPNFGSDVSMNNYARLLQRADYIENQRLDSHLPNVPNYYAMPQAQVRSVIPAERGLDAVAQTTNVLSKQGMQRNQIIGNSAAMTQAANSFNQVHHQKRHERVCAYLDRSANYGSQGRGLR